MGAEALTQGTERLRELLLRLPAELPLMTFSHVDYESVLVKSDGFNDLLTPSLTEAMILALELAPFLLAENEQKDQEIARLRKDIEAQDKWIAMNNGQP